MCWLLEVISISQAKACSSTGIYHKTKIDDHNTTAPWKMHSKFTSILVTGKNSCHWSSILQQALFIQGTFCRESKTIKDGLFLNLT